jgi:hypothetical protein
MDQLDIKRKEENTSKILETKNCGKKEEVRALLLMDQYTKETM